MYSGTESSTLGGQDCAASIREIKSFRLQLQRTRFFNLTMA